MIGTQTEPDKTNRSSLKLDRDSVLTPGLLPLLHSTLSEILL